MRCNRTELKTVMSRETTVEVWHCGTADSSRCGLRGTHISRRHPHKSSRSSSAPRAASTAMNRGFISEPLLASAQLVPDRAFALCCGIEAAATTYLACLLYLARPRIATKPTIPKRATSMTSAHSESVGMLLEPLEAVTTTNSFAALQIFAVGALLRSPP